MKKLICTLICIVLPLLGFCQSAPFLPTREGQTLLYRFYDGKGKPEKIRGVNDPLWVSYTVVEKESYPDSLIVQMRVESNIFEGNFPPAMLEDIQNLRYKYAMDTVYIKNFLESSSMLAASMASGRGGGAGSMEITTQSATALPAMLEAGMEFDDATTMELTTTVSSGLVNASTAFTYGYRNKKVESYEQVETPAGTFPCYKITYQFVARHEFGFMKNTSTEHVAEWYSPEIGLVKMERKNDKGKLLQTQILEEIE